VKHNLGPPVYMLCAALLRLSVIAWYGRL